MCHSEKWNVPFCFDTSNPIICFPALVQMSVTLREITDHVGTKSQVGLRFTAVSCVIRRSIPDLNVMFLFILLTLCSSIRGFFGSSLISWLFLFSMFSFFFFLPQGVWWTAVGRRMESQCWQLAVAFWECFCKRSCALVLPSGSWKEDRSNWRICQVC